MALLTEGTDVLITIRTYKVAVGNPSYEWNNVYEAVLAAGAGDPSTWEAFCEEFIDHEKAIHGGNVRYTRCVVSTWLADEGEYTSQNLFVYEAPGVIGTRTISGDPLPRHVVLLVKREVAFGRSGRLFYRGAVGEADLVGSSALDMTLASTSLSGLNTITQAMFTGMNASLAALGGAGSELQMIRPNDTGGVANRRRVSNLTARGLTINDPDHAYFDRAP